MAKKGKTKRSTVRSKRKPNNPKGFAARDMQCHPTARGAEDSSGPQFPIR